MVDTYALMIAHIIKNQQAVIGPIALDQAKKVGGFSIDSSGNVEISGNGKEVIENLVKQYEKLFGQASIEVCKDAVKEVMSQVSLKDIPDILK